MAVYEYKGLDSKGQAVSSILDADNPKSARVKLRKLGVFPTEIKEQQKGRSSSGSGLNMEIDLAKYFEFITVKDISQLTTQLSVLIGASIPMGEALAALVDQAEKSKLKVILSQVRESVNGGNTLADSIGKHPEAFEPLYVHMVRAGEQAGALDVVLKRLAKFSEDQVKLQGKIAAAMAYPALMSVIGIVVLAGLFVGVIPRIRSLFASFGGEDSLPLITRAVFFIGDTLTSWWVLVPILGFVFSIVGFRYWIGTESGRWRFDGLKLTVPLFGKMNRLVAVSQFSRTLSTLLFSGVPIMQALYIVREVVGNVVISDAIDKAATNIREGNSIAAPLKASKQFPPMVIHMITIGEKTGKLEQMLSSVADAYDDEVESTMAALTSILAPLMIMIMGGVIFVVAIGLLLPMSNMSQMIQN